MSIVETSTLTATATASPNLTLPIATNSPPSPVQEFNASTTTSSDLVQAIIRGGGVIVRNFASPSTLAALEAEMRPHLDADPGYDGDFFSKETRKANGLAARSTTFCTDVLSHPLWRGVYETLLTVTTSAWNGNDLKICTSQPQLSASAVIAIRPGGKAQPLHRDDMVHHVDNPAVSVDEYKIGRDTSVGLFLAGSKTTRLNGATRFQPKSHLQATREPPREEDAFYAELEAGDAFIMLASCYHGGSKNNSVDQERLMYIHFMIKGFLRQEENQFLTIPRERVLSYPEFVQRKVGYEVSQPYLGWVDLADPLDFIKGKETQHGDLF